MKKGMSALTALLMLVPAAGWAAQKQATLNVTGMFCGDCASKVKGELEKAPGVGSADVSLEKNSAVVKFDDSKTNPNKLADLVTDSGFETTVAAE